MHEIRPGDLVFDIGALDGEYTARYLSAGARVVAVEPQAGRAEALKARFAGRPVTVVNAAVGAEAGHGTIYYAAQPWLATMDPIKWGAGRFSGYTWDAGHPVEVVTLDNLIGTYGVPAFVKIDVEGWEPKVLAGLSHPLPWLSFEFNGDYLGDVHTCARRLLSLGRYTFAVAYGYEPPGKYRSIQFVMAELWASTMPLLWGDIYARVDNG